MGDVIDGAEPRAAANGTAGALDARARKLPSSSPKRVIARHRRLAASAGRHRLCRLLKRGPPHPPHPAEL